MSAPKKVDEYLDRVVAALLTETTRAAAAAKAGISEATLQRWLASEPTLQEAYREARRQLRDDAVLIGQKAATAAMAALLRNLRCGKPSAEIRAAEAILRHAACDAEQELADQIKALREQLTKRNR
jgi:hypothetical protein